MFVLALLRACCGVLLLSSAAVTEPEPTYPRITTRGQVQVQHDDGQLGSSSGDDPLPAANGIGVFPARDALSIRRIRVTTTLELDRDWSLVNETNFDTRSNSISVLDMYLRTRLGPDSDLRAGMFKIPFGWEGLRSSRSTNTIELSDVTRAFSSIRDSGLAVRWADGEWELQAALVQGQGGVWTDANAGKDGVGRVTYKVAPGIRVGASAQLGSYRPDFRTDNLFVQRWGLDLQVREGPWTVEAEYLRSDGFNFAAQREAPAAGYYLALVYQVDERNDVVLHFDTLDPDLSHSDLLRANNQANARSRLVVGWNHFLQRNPEHRIMLNWEMNQEREGPSVSNNGLRVRYQFAW